MIPDWVLYFVVLENILFYIVILKVMERTQIQPKQYWKYNPSELTRWNLEDQVVETRDHIGQEFIQVYEGEQGGQLIQWLEELDQAFGDKTQ